MVVFKRNFFNKDKSLHEMREDNFILLFYLHIQLYKNQSDICIFSPNVFFSKYNINYNSRSIKNLMNVMNYMSDKKYVSISNIYFGDNKHYYDKLEVLKKNDLFEIEVHRLKDGVSFIPFSDEFIVELLDSIIDNKEGIRVHKILEVYFTIVMLMFRDEATRTLGASSLSYDNIIESTSVKSKTTISKCVKILKDSSFIEYKKLASNKNEFVYNQYSLTKEAQELRE